MRTDYFESSEFRRLLSEYQYTLSSSDSRYFDVDDFVDLADYYVDYVSMDEALDVLGHGLRQHPDSDRLKLMLAGVHVCKYNYKIAEDILRTLDCPTDNNDFYYVSAQLQLALYSDYDEAERLFRTWICKEDDEIRADRDLPDADELRRDNYFHVLKSVREFVSDADKCRELMMQWVDEYMVVFSAEAPLGQFETDLLVAEVCRYENMSKQCEEFYTKLLDNDPYLENGWTILAAAQYTNGKYYECIDSAEYALAINSEDYFALFSKAHAYYAVANFAAALSDYLKYKECGLDSPDVFIASCLVRMNRHDEAVSYLESAEQWNEQTVLADNPEFYANNCYELAECYLLMGQGGKALEMAEKALAIAPENTEFLQCKGAALVAMDKQKEALKVFADSVELAENKFQAILFAGLRYLKADLPKVATRFFEAVLSGPTEDVPPQTYAYLTYAYYQQDNTEKFLEYLRIATDKCPEMLRDILGPSIPGVEPEGYYDYIMSLLDSRKPSE